MPHALQVLVFSIVILATLNARAEYAGADVYAEVNAMAYSEAMPIQQFIDELEGPRPGSGNIAFTFNSAEVGARYGRWTLAAFARYDYLLEFSDDTLDVAYADANDLDFPTGRALNINLQPSQISARGLGIGYQFTVSSQVEIFTRLNYLQADSLTDGSLTGTLTGNNEDSYEGELFLDYYYEKDLLLDRPEQDIEGDGYSVDVALAWSINQQWNVLLDVKDLYSEIEWQDVTYTQATAISNNASFGDDGLLDVVPLFSGIESNQDYTQRLPARTYLDVHYQFNTIWRFDAGYTEISDFQVVRLGWMAKVLGVDVSGGYQLQTQAFDMALEHKYVRLAVTTDSFEFDNAHLFGLSLGINIPVL